MYRAHKKRGGPGRETRDCENSSLMRVACVPFIFICLLRGLEQDPLTLLRLA